MQYRFRISERQKSNLPVPQNPHRRYRLKGQVAVKEGQVPNRPGVGPSHGAKAQQSNAYLFFGCRFHQIAPFCHRHFENKNTYSFYYNSIFCLLQ